MDQEAKEAQAAPPPAAAEAAKPTITLDGVTYDLASELSSEEIWPLAKTRILSGMRDPVDILAEAEKRAGNRPEMMRYLAEAAYRDMRDRDKSLTPLAIADWVGTIDGAVWWLWLRLKDKYPHLTEAKVRDGMIGMASKNGA